MPTTAFFLATPDDPISRGHALWNDPLPARPAGPSRQSGEDVGAITYGDYFTAVSDFCAANGWHAILSAASVKLERPFSEAELTHLSIFLEKHGAYYHPARLRVNIADQTLAFVVNVAVSDAGRQTLPDEVRALKRLNAQRPFGWLPTVYDTVSEPVPMFLGDWFDGFHEFHLTRQTDSDDLAIVVWDGADTRRLLSPCQATDLYRNAAMILTACYDPVTTGQVFPWHHAAGDFVVRIDGEKAAVRLITVRNHAPMIGVTPAPQNERALLDSLVAFFLHLSMRMRLDRLDGVADLAWAPATCLAPVTDGFFQGLDLTGRLSGFPESFPSIFRQYFNRHDAAEVADQAQRVLEDFFDGRSEEHQVIGRHLERHLDGIRQILARRE
jgi:hypothetical protein